MSRSSKVIILILVLIVAFQFAVDRMDTNKGREEYKETVYNYLVSLDDVVDILLDQSKTEDDMESACRSLILRMDRLVRFIYHSGAYLDFEYQPISIANLSYELEAMVYDDFIDKSELERLKFIDNELDGLIEQIGIAEDNDWNVNYDLSVEDINSAIESFGYKMK